MNSKMLINKDYRTEELKVKKRMPNCIVAQLTIYMFMLRLVYYSKKKVLIL